MTNSGKYALEIVREVPELLSKKSLTLRVYAVGELKTNCYILEYDGDAMVIDPGDEAVILLSHLKALRGGRLKYIVLTHGHCDHIGAVDIVAREMGGELIMGGADMPMLPDPMKNFSHYFGDPVKVTARPREAVDGEELSLGSMVFRVLHTPGHSEGSISIHGDGKVFCGDLLFRGSIGRTDFPGGDHDLLLASVRDRIFPLGGKTEIYPGHGEKTTVALEMSQNPFLMGLSGR